jgi:hypothetical protein
MLVAGSSPANGRLEGGSLMANSMILSEALCTGKRMIGTCHMHPDVIALHLTRREVRGLNVGMDGVQVLCASGALWITQAGDPNDHFLKPGDRFIATGRGRIVAEGL